MLACASSMDYGFCMHAYVYACGIVILRTFRVVFAAASEHACVAD